jgi:thiamine biosynthesis lipoprotein
MQDAAMRAIAEVRRIETKYSRYRDDSIVSAINRAAGRDEPVEVDDETDALLGFADRLHAMSDGLFDITSGVLRRAWDFRSGRVPSDAQIAACLTCIGWKLVERSPGLVRLSRAGMELDFGGFGKEYAADRAAELLLSAGHRHGYVNLGGDIRVLGPHADGRAWQFGIRHPRAADGLIAQWPLERGALATSGDYERYIETGGRRHCHILDPRTGRSAQGWASITVSAPACLAAGALSTIAMLKGDAALAFLDTQHARSLAIDTQLALHTTGGAPAIGT